MVMALPLAACGASEENGSDPPVPAPAASTFPDAKGLTLDELAEQGTSSNDIVVSPAGGVFTPGDERFSFGVFKADRSQIDDAEVAIYAQGENDDTASGPFPARIESLETDPAFEARTTQQDPDAAKVVYVADVPFKYTGEWRILAMIRTDEGLLTTRAPSVVVDTYPELPDKGDPAPRVSTPTAEDVGADLASIDTRVPPSSMHDVDLADVLGKQPVVLLFATPALCVSRVCGPVVDVAEQVKDRYGDKAAFIHMEIYKRNVPGPDNLRPQVQAYGLPTEPWVFVIDRHGIVQERIEGAFSVNELEHAVHKVVRRS